MKELVKRQHQVIKRLAHALDHELKCNCGLGKEECAAALSYAIDVLKEYEYTMTVPLKPVPMWLDQEWTCVDCRQVIPSKMIYHDCKGGTQP